MVTRIGLCAGALLLLAAGAGPAQKIEAERAHPLAGGDLPWVDVRDHGAAGDGTTDDTQAIRAAVQFAAGLDRPRLLFPPAMSYKTTDTVAVPAGIAVRMHAPILFAGDDQTAALVIGEIDVVNWNLEHLVRVEKQSVSDWRDEGSVGIVVHNAYACTIDVRWVNKFTIGLQCVGSGSGFAYNEVHLGAILNNRIGVDLTNFDPGTGIGWCNENVFLNGQFSAWSNIHPGDSRCGVRSTSRDGSYLGNNQNLFVKPSFELGAATAAPGEALPVLIEHGSLNRFESCRNEGNSPTFARVLNDSRDNEFDTGYGQRPVVDDQSDHPTSRATTRTTRLRDEPGAAVFLSGPLASRAIDYDGQGSVHVAGVHGAHSSSAAVRVAVDGIQVLPDHLDIQGNRAVGVLLDTSQHERFVLRRAVVLGVNGTDGSGRVRFRCYDDAGNVMVDPGGGVSLVTGDGSNPYWGSSFGGCYTQNSDSPADYLFTVADSVATVAVLLTGGTANLKLRSFALFSVDGGNAAVQAGYEEGIPGANRALAPPATGTWERGRIVYNDDPDAGEPLGWVCVQGGSPGVWKPIGNIGG